MSLGLHCAIVAALAIQTSAAAIPPLTDEQVRQLGSATDAAGSLDEGALYPLLENALRWEPGDRRGAQVPDYDAIRADPDAARGELYLIEGQFIGAAPRYRLSRSGPWGEALTGWGVVVDPQPPAVLVYFVDPDGSLTEDPPRYGAEVEVVGRFYKVWTDRDADGRQWDYLTFVARSAKVVRPDAGGTVDGDTLLLGMVLVLGVLVFLLWRVRGMVRRSPPGPPRPSHADAYMTPDDEPDPTLPADPDAALAELARRREQQGEG